MLLGKERGGDENYRVLRPGRRLKRTFLAAVVLLALLAVIPGWIQKGLWMHEPGYLGIFWKLLSIRVGLFSGAFVFAALYLWINLYLTGRNVSSFRASNLTKDATLEARPRVDFSLLQH
jgi:uncharacterized membrane protein (UPF0182 family)